MPAKKCHSTNFIAKSFHLLVGFVAVSGARRCYILYGKHGNDGSSSGGNFAGLSLMVLFLSKH